MEDSKHLAENSKKSLPDDDDVICISDDCAPVSEEVEDVSLAVTSCDIWIDEKASHNFNPSSSGNDGWLENDAETGGNLKDPLCVEGYCEENETITRALPQVALVPPSCLDGSPVIDLTIDEDNSTVFDVSSVRELDNIAENRPKNDPSSVSDDIKILFKEKRRSINKTLRKIDMYYHLFQCTGCEYRSNQPNRIFSHIKYHHVLNRRYNCNKCDFKASLKTTLEEHERVKHPNERTFRCKYCTYTSHKTSSVLIHTARIHFK